MVERTLDMRTFVLGDKKGVGVKNVHTKEDGALDGTTVTFTLYDRTGTTLVSAADMTLVWHDSTSFDARYSLDMSAAGVITRRGLYRGVYTFTLPDGTVESWQQYFTVLSRPN